MTRAEMNSSLDHGNKNIWQGMCEAQEQKVSAMRWLSSLKRSRQTSIENHTKQDAENESQV